MGNDVFYYLMRASEEREAAMRSRHPKARSAHREMARLYQELANGDCRRSLEVRFTFAGAA